jgi:hypothetical protein
VDQTDEAGVGHRGSSQPLREKPRRGVIISLRGWPVVAELVTGCRMPKPHGNGSGKFDVGVHDMGGWVRVIAGESPDSPDDLGFYLSHRLAAWFRENPHLRLLCVVPVNKGGTTVELHAWYEQHLFPDTSPLARS